MIKPVFIFTDELPPALGGVGNVMYNLVTLFQKDFDVHLISFDEYLNDTLYLKFDVVQYGIKKKYWKNFRDIQLCYIYIKIYIRYGKELPWLFSSWNQIRPLRYLNFIFKWNYHVYAHGTDISRLEERGRVKKCLKSLEGAKSVICVSSYLKRKLLKHHFKSEKLHVIENGVNHHQYFPIKNFNTKKALNITQKFVLLSASRFHPIKGFPLAIKLIKHMLDNGIEDFKYYILGRGSHAEEKELRSLVKKLAVEKYVEFRGFIHPYNDFTNSYSTLNVYYNATDVFLNLNIKLPDGSEDACPLNIREAAAAGAIVMAGNNGGLAESIKTNETGFLVDTSDEGKAIDELFKIIVSLMKNSDLKKNISENARAYFSVRKNWENQYKKLLKIMKL